MDVKEDIKMSYQFTRMRVCGGRRTSWGFLVLPSRRFNSPPLKSYLMAPIGKARLTTAACFLLICSCRASFIQLCVELHAGGLYFCKFLCPSCSRKRWIFRGPVTVTDTVDLPLLGGRPPAALPLRLLRRAVGFSGTGVGNPMALKRSFWSGELTSSSLQGLGTCK